MLQKLIDIGKANFNFCECSVKDLDKSCCIDQECELIDFDRAKEAIVKNANLATLCSCDGLWICVDKNCIDFVEMKGFEEFKKCNPDPKAGAIDKQIKKFDFHKKLHDSYFLLQTIINSSKFAATNDEHQTFYLAQKRYFIATDIKLKENAVFDILFRLEFLAEASNIDREIETCLRSQVDQVQDVYYLTEKPKIVECRELCNVLC